VARELHVKITIDQLEAKRKLAELDQELDKLETDFKVGALSAEQYYNKLTELSKRTQDANKSTKDLRQSQDKLAEKKTATASATDMLNKAIARYLTAGAVLGAIKSTLDYAASLEKMHAATGISFQGLQQLENVAVGTNTSLQTLTGGVLDLQRRLATGDNSAAAAMRRLRLDTEEFLTLKGDEQFREIALALRTIPSEVERNELAFRLFGRAYKEILPAITSDIDTLRDSVRVMTDEQVAQVARVETQWNQLILTGKRYLLEVVDQLATGSKLQPWLDEFARLSSLWLSGPGGLPDVSARPLPVPDPFLPTQMFDEQFGATTALTHALEDLDAELTTVTKTQEEAAKAAKVHRLAVQDLEDRSTSFHDVIRDMNPDLGETVRLHLGHGASVATVATALRMAERDVAAMAEQLKFEQSVVNQSSKEHVLWGVSLRGVGKSAEEFRIQVRGLTADGLIAADSLDLVAMSFDTVEAAQGRASTAFETVGQAAAESADRFQEVKEEALATEPPIQTMIGGLISLSDVFVKLAQVSGDSFGGIVKDIANVVVALELADRAAAQFEQKGWENKVGGIIGGISAVAQATGSGSRGARIAGGAITGAQVGTMIMPGIGTAVGAGVGALVGMFRGGEGKELNKIRDAAFEAAGGFDALNAALYEVSRSDFFMRKLLTADTTEEWEAAWSDATTVLAIHRDELARTEQQIEDMQSIVGDVTGRMSGLRELGPGLRSALDTAFSAENAEDFLSAMKDVTRELDKQIQHAKDVDLAMQLLGVSWEILGEQARTMRLGESFLEIRDAISLVVAEGADMNAVIMAAGPQLSALVQAAQRTGTEVPAFMQPILQQAIDLGVLVDEDKDKYTDLGNLKFGTTLEDSIGDVADATGQLADTLEERVAVAIETMADRIAAAIEAMSADIAAALRGISGAAQDVTRDINGIPTHVTVGVTYDVEPPPQVAGFDTGTEFHRGGTVMHGGGVIEQAAHVSNVLPFLPRAHRGLAVDERLIVAQTGEGILSRRDMRQLGGPAGFETFRSDLHRSGSSLTVTVGDITVTGGDSADDIGREVGDAVTQKLKQQGYRFSRSRYAS